MERNGKVFVAVQDGGKPSLGVRLEVGVCQEWDGQGKIALGWCEIAISQCLVDEVNGPTASWFFKAGSHTAYGIDFELGVAS